MVMLLQLVVHFPEPRVGKATSCRANSRIQASQNNLVAGTDENETIYIYTYIYNIHIYTYIYIYIIYISSVCPARISYALKLLPRAARIWLPSW